MENFPLEMIEKVKDAKSAEELLELAKANGIQLTADEAKACFEQLNGALDDDALDDVSGGAAVGIAEKASSKKFDKNAKYTSKNAFI